MHHLEIEARERISEDILAGRYTPNEESLGSYIAGLGDIYQDAHKESLMLDDCEALNWQNDVNCQGFDGLNDCTAEGYLAAAQSEMQDRAASRDQLNGERSMARAVEAFNVLYGHDLTVTEGWQFMSILKKSRGSGGAYREDDYIDDIAYCALAAEAAWESV